MSSITLTSGANISLYVEDCSFIECYSVGHGGAIYISAESNCVLKKICANKCNTAPDQYGQFCYIRVKANSINMNFAHLVSVCECSNTVNNDLYSSICFDYGNVSLNNVNSSANRCYMYSGVRLFDPTLSYTTQSTFSNNTDYNSRCIYIGYQTHQMSQCNFIRNHQNTTFVGTISIWNNASTIFSDCIIDMNTGAIKIIYVTLGNATLNSCYLQSNIQSFGTISINEPISSNQSLILYHFSSHYCDAMNIRPTETLKGTPFETPIDTFRETPYDSPINSSQQSDGSVFSTGTIVGISSGTGAVSIGIIFGAKYFYNIASDSIEDSGEEIDQNNPIVIMIQQNDPIDT